MNVLQVCARIPSPPDDGGAVYVYNITKQLHRLGHNVTVASLISSFHRQDIDDLKKFATVFAQDGKFTSYGISAAIKSLLARKPITVQHRMKKLIMLDIISSITERIDIILLEGLQTAYFIPELKNKFPDTPIILQQVNVEFHLLEQKAASAKNPFLKFFLYDQARLMKKFEFDTLKKVNAITFISNNDLDFFKKFIPDLNAEVIVPGSNLVNSTNFDHRNENELLAISNWKWHPNLEGLIWFIENVWPELKNKFPKLTFTIVGDGLTEKFTALLPSGTSYLGFVDDLTELKNRATLQVIPLLSGSGVKIKVIDAISSGIPVITTDFGIEGTLLIPNKHCLLANTVNEFINQITKALLDKNLRKSISQSAFTLASENYSWNRQGELLNLFLQSLTSNN